MRSVSLQCSCWERREFTLRELAIFPQFSSNCSTQMLTCLEIKLSYYIFPSTAATCLHFSPLFSLFSQYVWIPESLRPRPFSPSQAPLQLQVRSENIFFIRNLNRTFLLLLAGIAFLLQLSLIIQSEYDWRRNRWFQQPTHWLLENLINLKRFPSPSSLDTWGKSR